MIDYNKYYTHEFMQLSQTWLLIQSEAGYSLQNALDAYPLEIFNSASASAEKLCKFRSNCIEVSTHFPTLRSASRHEIVNRMKSLTEIILRNHRRRASS